MPHSLLCTWTGGAGRPRPSLRRAARRPRTRATAQPPAPPPRPAVARRAPPAPAPAPPVLSAESPRSDQRSPHTSGGAPIEMGELGGWGDGAGGRARTFDVRHGSAPASSVASPAQRPTEGEDMNMIQKWRRGPWAVPIISGLLIVASFLAPAGGWTDLLMVAAAVVAGWGIVVKAVRALTARVIGIDLLVSIAAIGAVVIGEYWEAAAVTFLFAVGHALETATLNRTRSALRSEE